MDSATTLGLSKMAFFIIIMVNMRMMVILKAMLRVIFPELSHAHALTLKTPSLLLEEALPLRSLHFEPLLTSIQSLLLGHALLAIGDGLG